MLRFELVKFKLVLTSAMGYGSFFIKLVQRF